MRGASMQVTGCGRRVIESVGEAFDMLITAQAYHDMAPHDAATGIVSTYLSPLVTSTYLLLGRTGRLNPVRGRAESPGSA
jgi:hypothetical protein